MQTEINIEAAYPLLPAQQGLLVDSLAGESELYRQQICVKLATPISNSRLVDTIIRSVERHSILRTIFDWTDSTPLRVIINGIKPQILSTTADSHNAVQQILESEKDNLKPLSDTPPIRFAIIQTQDAQLLAITYHHILLDGPSINLLLQEIITDETTSISEDSLYQDWVTRTIDATEYSIWKAMLSAVDHKAGHIAHTENQAQHKHSAHLTEETFSQIKDRAKQLRVSPATHMQALWSSWASAYFTQSPFLYGLVLSTRMPNLTDTALGPYISIVPWVTPSSSDFNTLVTKTDEQLHNIEQAKHVPLGGIIKHGGSAALQFDSILTITTQPVSGNPLYEVYATSEKTGYALSVDIEITDTITVAFSTSLKDMHSALQSFINYCDAQAWTSELVTINETYQEPESITQAVSTHMDTDTLARHILNVLELDSNTPTISMSFLELGGDSITALRLKSNLRKSGYTVSISDILRSESIVELSGQVFASSTTDLEQSTPHVSAPIRDALTQQFEHTYIDSCYIPSSAQTIVNNYLRGYEKDYHEQTAFQLATLPEKDTFTKALNLLADELPTLRIVFPNAYPGIQVLTTTPRVSAQYTDASQQRFEEFVTYTSTKDASESFDLQSGPLLRVVVGETKQEGAYLFMSFSAVITDGWSFSIMLERLFQIYTALLSNSYTAAPQDIYFEIAKKVSQKSAEQPLEQRTLKSNTPKGQDFIIDASITSSIVNKSKRFKTTVNTVLFDALSSLLEADSFSAIAVYENGRDDEHSFASVGPYSHLSTVPLNLSGQQTAYYVFENYPKDSENRLKSGEVAGFNENKNWRKDLLPPAATLGFLFEEQGETIHLRILTRNHTDNASAYVEKLLTILQKD